MFLEFTSDEEKRLPSPRRSFRADRQPGLSRHADRPKHSLYSNGLYMAVWRFGGLVLDRMRCQTTNSCKYCKLLFSSQPSHTFALFVSRFNPYTPFSSNPKVRFAKNTNTPPSPPNFYKLRLNFCGSIQHSASPMRSAQPCSQSPQSSPHPCRSWRTLCTPGCTG